MALVNPNIAMSFRQPEIQAPNALAQYAQLQQIESGRQAQELNALKMQEAQALMQERNALRQLNPAAEDYENQLFKVSPQLGIQYRKEAATTAAQKAAAAKSAFDLKAAQRKFGEDLKRGLSANPSDENIIAFGQSAVKQGLYTPTEVENTVSQLLALPVAERVRILSQAGASAGELKPTIKSIDTGGAVNLVNVPAFGGTPTTIGTQTKTLTPGEAKPTVSNVDVGGAILTQEYDPRTRTTRVLQTRLKTLTPGEARTASQEKSKVAHTTTDEAGNVTMYNMFGSVIGAKDASGAPVAIKGKPSAAFEKTRNQREQLSKDLTSAISELTDITKEGGLIDKSTGSGAGRAVDVAAGIFGQATSGAIASAKLAPIADLVLKMVPRFEGPQSDKDTASYKQAAGQLADPSLPSAIRKEAGKTVLRLMKNRKNQFVTQGMAAEGINAGGPSPAPARVGGPAVVPARVGGPAVAPKRPIAPPSGFTPD